MEGEGKRRERIKNRVLFASKIHGMTLKNLLKAWHGGENEKHEGRKTWDGMSLMWIAGGRGERRGARGRWRVWIMRSVECVEEETRRVEEGKGLEGFLVKNVRGGVRRRCFVRWNMKCETSSEWAARPPPVIWSSLSLQIYIVSCVHECITFFVIIIVPVVVYSDLWLGLVCVCMCMYSSDTQYTYTSPAGIVF